MAIRRGNVPAPPPQQIVAGWRERSGRGDFYVDTDVNESMDHTMRGRFQNGNEDSPLQSAYTVESTALDEPESQPASEAGDEVSEKSVRLQRRRNPAKVPWDPYLYKSADLKGNSEQCGCGNVFLDEDTFCYRCGNRRLVDVTPLPLHVSRIPEPPIDALPERMAAWQEAYTQRKMALQSLKRENEDMAGKLARHGMPQIAPLSNELAADLRPISERYKGVLWMRELSLQRERDRVGKEKVQEYTLTPQITRRARSLESRSVDDLFNHKKRTEKQIEMKRQEKRYEEMVECTFQPELIKSRYELHHPQKVHDRLYRDASQRRTNLEEDQKNAELEWKLDNLRSARSESPITPRNQTPRSYTQLVRAYKEKTPGNKPTKPISARAVMETNVAPTSKRGPRASAPVLYGKEELQQMQQRTRSRDRKGRRAQQPRTISPDGVDNIFPSSSPASNILGDASTSCLGASSRSSSSRRSRRERSYEAYREPPKPEWTGGQNVVHATARFKTLLEKLEPGYEEANMMSRKSRRSTSTSTPRASSSNPQRASRKDSKRNTLRSQVFNSVYNW